jgi:hypothetical protein
MVLPLRALSSAQRWADEGYTYTVMMSRTVGIIVLEVSRVLIAGRMSPIVGRRAFVQDEEPLLGAILGAPGPARTLLVDRIIRGGPLLLHDVLKESACEADLG